MGVEPAENICEIARENGIDTLCGFFDNNIASNIINIKGRADVITANNVFAHVHDIKDLTKNVKKLLKENGVFIIEVQYLLDTIKNLTFDNIYHEHVSYFSVMSLAEFFRQQEMEMFKVEHADTHGGSVRAYIQNKGGRNIIDKSVIDFLEAERIFGLDKFETYQKFAMRINDAKERIRAFTIRAKNEGKKIIGYGAPAKATTLLNFYNIGNEHIDYIIEDNPLKQGKTVPGVRIPIVSKQSLGTIAPDYIYLLAWNFADEIIKKNPGLSQNGAKFVIPSAEMKVI